MAVSAGSALDLILLNPAVEEWIDELIASKRGLAQNLLEGGADLLLTEMKDEELLRLVNLNHLRRAVAPCNGLRKTAA